ERHPLSDRDSAGGRRLGGHALERHRLPPCLLLEVPPLRQVLPAVGARRVSGRAMSEREAVAPWPPPLRQIEALGRAFVDMVQALGRFGRFLVEALAYILLPPFSSHRLLDRINFIGFRSLPIVILTGASTGMVLGLQIFPTLSRFGSEAFLGPAVALSLIRELGPVLCAVFVTGLAGSALTAEI